jgi:hypothetical protein
VTLRSCVLSPTAEERSVQISQVRINASRVGASPLGAGLPLRLFQARVQPRLRSLYHYTMCKRIAKPVARTVGACSEPSSHGGALRRHRPAGGTATPAGVPFGSAFCRPESVVSESLECAGGSLREDSKKGSPPMRPFGLLGRSLSMAMLTSPLKSAPASASAVPGLFTAGAPARLLLRSGWVRREGSYLVDPASSHMLVSKIKPCMSKYKLLYTVKLRMAH